MLRGSGAGNLGVPLKGTRRVGGLLGVAGSCQGPSRPSGRNRGLPLRRRRGQGPHLAKRWDHVVFLELRRHSRVTTGISAFPGVGPGKPNLPLELQGKSGGCARVTAGPKRPHLGVCPGPSSTLKARQGSRVCTPESPVESGLASRGSKGLRSSLEPRLGSLGAL